MTRRDRRCGEHGEGQWLRETRADSDGWDDWLAWEPIELEWDPDAEYAEDAE